jgi:site-specific DNA-methyltransferase (adenine-specific)
VRIETIGNATMYLADCMDVLPLLRRVDAVVTDPPYGIDIAAASTIGGDGSTVEGKRLRKPTGARKHDVSEWDRRGMSSDQWAAIRALTDRYIVWGGNHLADVLGPSAGVLAWDKKCQNGWDDTFSELEFAWTNAITRTKGFRHLWAGAIRASEQEADVRKHPTQKPIALMEWCLSFVPDARSVLDPFAGSGTTGVAAMHMGRQFIGIEREPKYFAIACERISAAQSQGRLFA